MTAHSLPHLDGVLVHLTDDELRAVFARVQSVLLDRHATDALLVDVLSEQEARLLRGFRTLSPLHQDDLCERVNAKAYELEAMTVQ